MSKVTFTNEEIEILKSNLYVKKVGDKSISFTKEFQEIIVREGRSGKPRITILRDLGLNCNMLWQTTSELDVQTLSQSVDTQ